MKAFPREAVIFDIDGMLVDSERAYAQEMAERIIDTLPELLEP